MNVPARGEKYRSFDGNQEVEVVSVDLAVEGAVFVVPAGSPQSTEPQKVSYKDFANGYQLADGDQARRREVDQAARQAYRKTTGIGDQEEKPGADKATDEQKKPTSSPPVTERAPRDRPPTIDKERP